MIIRNLFLSFFVLVILSNCGLEADCEWVEELPEFETTEAAPGFKVSEMITFNENFDSLQVEDVLVIQDSSTYNAIRNRHLGNCGDCFFPEIDFETTTLIGWYKNLGCLGVIYPKVVKIDDTNYEYLIKFINGTQCQFASCSDLRIVWAELDKIPENASITTREGLSRYVCENC